MSKHASSNTQYNVQSTNPYSDIIITLNLILLHSFQLYWTYKHYNN